MIALTAGTTPALAHGGGDIASGFLGGFAHPLLGPDHVAAMVAVGLWGAMLGSPALWLLPVAFPLVMAFGGVLGIAGVPIPHVEIPLALLLVAALAVFHGHAHGAELPPGADAVAFSAGFVVATGILHLCGIGFGVTTCRPAGRLAVRLTGAAITIAGVAFLRAAP